MFCTNKPKQTQTRFQNFDELANWFSNFGLGTEPEPVT